jgi:hypothetical protein
LFLFHWNDFLERALQSARIVRADFLGGFNEPLRLLGVFGFGGLARHESSYTSKRVSMKGRWSMHLVHFVQKSYRDPRFDFPTINTARVYEDDSAKALAAIQATAAPFEKVELVGSEVVSDEEYNFVRNTWG